MKDSLILNLQVKSKIVWTPVGSKIPVLVVSIPSYGSDTVTVSTGTLDVYVLTNQWYEAGTIMIHPGDEHTLT